MKIVCVNSPLNFKRALNENELKEYTTVLKQAKETVGQTGRDIFIMPSTCLPQNPELNTGLGNWASKNSLEYIKYMQKYLGFNAVEDLPAGQYKSHNGLYCSYTGTAFALGNNQICPELLTTKEFEYLLTEGEVQQIVKANNAETKNELCNFKNALSNSGKQNEVLKRAFERFEKLDNNNSLKQKYKKYIDENKDWLNFERVGEENLEFFKFKQFLADEHLKIGKENLNKQGLKLYGDCLIGFSADEVKAFPKAFKKDHYIGMPEWHLPALNYHEILDDSSEASKLLKRKIQLFAKRYDSIRFDVAWAYVTPVVTPKGTNEILEKNKVYLDGKLLDKIESWVKEIKGDNFDVKDLVYEFDAGPSEFAAFNDKGLLPALKGRTKVYGSTYMSNDWGFYNEYVRRTGGPEEFTLGVGNHDPQPLRQIAEGIKEEISVYDANSGKFVSIFEDHKTPAIKPLAKELKLDENKLRDPVEFAKAKHAEPLKAKNHHSFYMDVFGRRDRFDMQGFNTTRHTERNYAYKVPSDYKQAYHQSLQEGFGFNIMDGFEKIFKANGYDKSHPELYKKIVKFNKILQEKETFVHKVEETTTNISKQGNKVAKYAGLAGAIVLVTIGAIFAFKKARTENRQFAETKA